MNGNCRITVVGSNMVDLVSYLDRIPERGETVFGRSFEQGFGGKGANQAVMAALLGGQVDIVTCVGDDLSARNGSTISRHVASALAI
ncbi:PfkB family carbohydrate kinase [Mesorhizobium sp. Root552]|uniref:PfkB family carbohydrate kinase n=1 Tax=Mesorhizobium sp. Root552 TaxID=1736555 RepID=UPI0009E86E13|nr:PfkB family carbohydrate kinase [Mesorhizobium sp. Root552]